MTPNLFRLRTVNPPAEQKVGWLELFYDLVYVAAVIALGNKLSHDLSSKGVTEFVILFIPIWWSWTGVTFYATRFRTNDVGHRLLIFVQMFAVAALAISVSEGLGETSRNFALAYTLVRAVLVLMYLGAGQQWPEMRKLTNRYALGFALAAGVWLVSAFVEPPLRFYLWGIGLIIDFGTPLLPGSRRLQTEFPPDTHHLPERFGLFTIIVLGEAFIKVVDSASEHPLLPTAALYGALGLVVAVSLWWIYFDNTDGSVVRRTLVAGQVWVYTHLPLVIAITAFGVAMKKVVLLEADHGLASYERWLLCGAVAVALLAIAALDLTTQQRQDQFSRQRVALARIIGGGLLIMIGAAGGSLEPAIIMLLVALVAAAQVVIDVYSRMNSPQTVEITGH